MESSLEFSFLTAGRVNGCFNSFPAVQAKQSPALKAGVGGAWVGGPKLQGGWRARSPPPADSPPPAPSSVGKFHSVRRRRPLLVGDARLEPRPLALAWGRAP